MLARLTSLRALGTLLAALLLLHSRPARADQDEKESDTEEEAGSEEADTGKVDPNQPSVYSGGRYTIINFPLSELDRTLLLVEGVLELRADLGIDMTKGVTFKTWDIALQGRYGLNDTMELQAGTDIVFAAPEGANKAKSVFAAIEGSIMYDMVDWRVGVNLPIDPTRFDVFFGLPVKIRILKKRLAIVALEKILTLHTHSTKDAAGDSSLDKPDLTVSLGFLVQVIEQLAVIVRAEVTSVGFEGDPVVALRADGQYSINNRMDVGVSLILKNLTAKEAQVDPMTDPKRVPLDNRGIAVFFRFRI